MTGQTVAAAQQQQHALAGELLIFALRKDTVHHSNTCSFRSACVPLGGRRQRTRLVSFFFSFCGGRSFRQQRFVVCHTLLAVVRIARGRRETTRIQAAVDLRSTWAEFEVQLARSNAKQESKMPTIDATRDDDNNKQARTNNDQ